MVIFLLFCYFFVVLFVVYVGIIYFSEMLDTSYFRETISAFECGFDSSSKARIPFSLRFFLILIFFLILDIEVCLLLQLPYEINNELFSNRLHFFFFFFVFLIGVIEEFRRGLLVWKK
uniref:NADH-ubiquinone oxidoreductase chain 3 n=1 Tax=Bipalium adventitium TaxID=66751 RepID=A0A8K1X792_9PLAT|nr:NADH dehydrogenase subunit 3 [Bipalium adventitium]